MAPQDGVLTAEQLPCRLTPLGKLEPGEDTATTAVREAEEEIR
jgi:8-oxo-dGTP pyrophosphatase MutT (NUDIX family)